MKSLMIAFFAGLLATSSLHAQSSNLETEIVVKKHLQKLFANERDSDTTYKVAFADLDGDGKPEALVYVSGSDWCGSGGCTLMVLTPERTYYREVVETTITRPPIRILMSKTNGWNDLGVFVAGGGILPGYEAKLSFNGKKYPSNPSMTPHATRGAEGKTIITDKQKAKFLFP